MSFEQFQSLLDSLKSPNNEERGEAEEIFTNLLSSNGMTVVEFLIQTTQINPSNHNTILYSLVLLKNIFNKYQEIFLEDQSFDQQIQSFLLSLIDNPSNSEKIQLNVASLVVAAADLYLKGQRWPSFQSDIMQRCSSQNIISLSISLDCLVLSINNELVDVQLVAPLIDDWYQMIWPLEPNYAHLLIIRLILILARNQCECQCFSHFIANFPDYISELPFQFANIILSDLTNYTDIIINLFGDNFEPLFECLINIFVNEEREKGEREQVLELLLEISESSPNEMYQCVEVIFESLMSVICEISGPDFLNEDYEDPTPRTSSENSIERFVFCFKGQEGFFDLLYSIFDNYNKMADSPEKYRAGFVLIKNAIEYLDSFFYNGTAQEDLVNRILEGIQFPNEFCQFASFQVLTEAARHFNPIFQTNYNSSFIPSILEYIQSNLAISQFALESLSYMISGSNNEDIEPYLEVLYDSMISIFGQIPIQAQVFDLNCISELIMKSGQQIENYYQVIMPVLVGVIQMEELTLTLSAIKAFSMISYVYESEEFISDAKKFIDFIMTIKRENLSDYQNDTINTALKSLVMHLGSNFPEEFSQILLSVIDIVDQSVTPQQIPLASDRSDVKDEILVPNEKENILYVYSHIQLDEIYQSIVTLDSFLLEIGEFVSSYYQKIIEVCIKTISYFFDDKIQSETVNCLQGLALALKENDASDYNAFQLVIDSLNEVVLNRYQKIEIINIFMEFLILLFDLIPSLETVESSFLESLLLFVLKTVEKCQSLDEEEQIFLLSTFTYIGKILKFITKCPQINEQISGKLHLLSEQEFALSSEIPPFSIPGVALFWISFVVNILHDPGLFSNVLHFICSSINFDNDDDENESIIMTLPDMIESDLFNANENLDSIVSTLSDFLSSINEENTELKKSIDASVYVFTCLFQKFNDLLNNQDLVSLWFGLMPLQGKKNACFRNCFQKVYDFLLILISQNHPVVSQNLNHLLKIVAKATNGFNSSDEARANFRDFINTISSDPQTKDDFENSFNELDTKDKDRILRLIENDEEEEN